MNDVYKVIVCLTTHSIRLQKVGKILFNILSCSFKELHVVLTLYKDDIKHIPEDVKMMINAGLVELIIADKDLGPHLKYYYVMIKYRDLPIITIDDDALYPDDMVEKMYNVWLKNKNCIIGRRCFDIGVSNGKLTSYNKWILEYTQKTKPTHSIFATGIGGVLYPPNCFRLGEEHINEILDIKYDDDFYLKALEVRNGLKILAIEHEPAKIYKKNLNDKETQSIALWNKNRVTSNVNVLKFEKEFLEAAYDKN